MAMKFIVKFSVEKPWNGLLICIHMRSVWFQILIQLWSGIWWILDVSVALLKMIYTMVQNVIIYHCRCFNFEFFLYVFISEVFCLSWLIIQRKRFLFAWIALRWNYGKFHPYPRQKVTTRSWGLDISTSIWGRT